ncbi:hypothetical protein GCM10011584_07950 [Nocardioides phosphati]|uniref:SDR-like Ig domain-containing protein n=2 Tax=Nocardioides phosphati TaxID=1867775 RepID=A0ABQ2N861_9ACTN|nr:hypothetical protein GCM10011584_07950 [Nocardioides phosphati]
MKSSFRQRAALAAAVSLVGLASTGWTVPSVGATQGGATGQGAYICQSRPKGLPVESYDVTLRMSLNAPTSVRPGQTVSLSGTASMQFPEKAYQDGKAVGETEADGYSSTLSVATTANGRTTDVAANRWQTAPFPWTDPVVITAPITFQPFTVPANASGSVTITLPRNERRAPNTATSSPATVAFNGVANNKTALGNVSENLGCYLQGTAPIVIARIPVTATATAPAAGTGASGGQRAVTSSAAASSATGSAGGTGSATPQAAAADPSLPDPGAGGVAAPAGGVAAEGASVAAPYAGDAALQSQGGAAYPTATAPRSGVFVNTNVLLLSGGLVCLVALGYALLSQYRLRNLKRTMELE